MLSGGGGGKKNQARGEKARGNADVYLSSRPACMTVGQMKENIQSEAIKGTVSCQKGEMETNPVQRTEV